jgi:uncharacterized protein (TIGR00369 family)
MSHEDSVPRLNNLAESLGMEITDFSEGVCVVELTVEEKHLNMGGMAHGGVHATLLDTAMGGTLVSIISKEEWCATAQLDISYLDAVNEGVHLVATAEVVRRGRNLAHVEGKLATGEGKLVATAKGTWAIWETRPKRRGG